MASLAADRLLGFFLSDDQNPYLPATGMWRRHFLARRAFLCSKTCLGWYEKQFVPRLLLPSGFDGNPYTHPGNTLSSTYTVTLPSNRFQEEGSNLWDMLY
ncbi:hypothetical protein Tco_0001568 [Tanacetum coccineum]